MINNLAIALLNLHSVASRAPKAWRVIAWLLRHAIVLQLLLWVLEHGTPSFAAPFISQVLQAVTWIRLDLSVVPTAATIAALFAIGLAAAVVIHGLMLVNVSAHTKHEFNQTQATPVVKTSWTRPGWVATVATRTWKLDPASYAWLRQHLMTPSTSRLLVRSPLALSLSHPMPMQTATHVLYTVLLPAIGPAAVAAAALLAACPAGYPQLRSSYSERIDATSFCASGVLANALRVPAGLAAVVLVGACLLAATSISGSRSWEEGCVADSVFLSHDMLDMVSLLAVSVGMSAASVAVPQLGAMALYLALAGAHAGVHFSIKGSVCASGDYLRLCWSTVVVAGTGIGCVSALMHVAAMEALSAAGIDVSILAALAACAIAVYHSSYSMWSSLQVDLVQLAHELSVECPQLSARTAGAVALAGQVATAFLFKRWQGQSTTLLSLRFRAAVAWLIRTFADQRQFGSVPPSTSRWIAVYELYIQALQSQIVRVGTDGYLRSSALQAVQSLQILSNAPLNLTATQLLLNCYKAGSPMATLQAWFMLGLREVRHAQRPNSLDIRLGLRGPELSAQAETRTLQSLEAAVDCRKQLLQSVASGARIDTQHAIFSLPMMESAAAELLDAHRSAYANVALLRLVHGNVSILNGAIDELQRELVPQRLRMLQDKPLIRESKRVLAPAAGSAPDGSPTVPMSPISLPDDSASMVDKLSPPFPSVTMDDEGEPQLAMLRNARDAFQLSAAPTVRVGLTHPWYGAALPDDTFEALSAWHEGKLATWAVLADVNSGGFGRILHQNLAASTLFGHVQGEVFSSLCACVPSSLAGKQLQHVLQLAGALPGIVARGDLVDWQGQWWRMPMLVSRSLSGQDSVVAPALLSVAEGRTFNKQSVVIISAAVLQCSAYEGMVVLMQARQENGTWNEKWSISGGAGLAKPTSRAACDLGDNVASWWSEAVSLADDSEAADLDVEGDIVVNDMPCKLRGWVVQSIARARDAQVAIEEQSDDTAWVRYAVCHVGAQQQAQSTADQRRFSASEEGADRSVLRPQVHPAIASAQSLPDTGTIDSMGVSLPDAAVLGRRAGERAMAALVDGAEEGSVNNNPRQLIALQPPVAKALAARVRVMRAIKWCQLSLAMFMLGVLGLYVIGQGVVLRSSTIQRRIQWGAALQVAMTMQFTSMDVLSAPSIAALQQTSPDWPARLAQCRAALHDLQAVLSFAQQDVALESLTTADVLGKLRDSQASAWLTTLSPVQTTGNSTALDQSQHALQRAWDRSGLGSEVWLPVAGDVAVSGGPGFAAQVVVGLPGNHSGAYSCEQGTAEFAAELLRVRSDIIDAPHAAGAAMGSLSGWLHLNDAWNTSVLLASMRFAAASDPTVIISAYTPASIGIALALFGGVAAAMLARRLIQRRAKASYALARVASDHSGMRGLPLQLDGFRVSCLRTCWSISWVLCLLSVVMTGGGNYLISVSVQDVQHDVSNWVSSQLLTHTVHVAELVLRAGAVHDNVQAVQQLQRQLQVVHAAGQQVQHKLALGYHISPLLTNSMLDFYQDDWANAPTSPLVEHQLLHGNWCALMPQWYAGLEASIADPVLADRAASERAAKGMIDATRGLASSAECMDIWGGAAEHGLVSVRDTMVGEAQEVLGNALSVVAKARQLDAGVLAHSKFPNTTGVLVIDDGVTCAGLAEPIAVVHSEAVVHVLLPDRWRHVVCSPGGCGSQPNASTSAYALNALEDPLPVMFTNTRLSSAELAAVQDLCTRGRTLAAMPSAAANRTFTHYLYQLQNPPARARQAHDLWRAASRLVQPMSLLWPMQHQGAARIAANEAFLVSYIVYGALMCVAVIVQVLACKLPHLHRAMLPEITLRHASTVAQSHVQQAALSTRNGGSRFFGEED